MVVVDWWSLVLPNFNWVTVIAIAVIILGIVGIYFGMWKKGLITVVVGLAVMFLYSFLEDVFSNVYYTIIFVGIVGLVLMGYFLFSGDKKNKGGKKR